MGSRVATSVKLPLSTRDRNTMRYHCLFVIDYIDDVLIKDGETISINRVYNKNRERSDNYSSINITKGSL